MDLNLDVYDFFRKSNPMGHSGQIGHASHHHEASSCCNYDIDSVSQISALDSASQTGHSDLGHCAGSSRDRHPVVNPKMFSCSDSNIHRSSLQKHPQQTFTGTDGTAAAR